MVTWFICHLWAFPHADIHQPAAWAHLICPAGASPSCSVKLSVVTRGPCPFFPPCFYYSPVYPSFMVLPAYWWSLESQDPITGSPVPLTCSTLRGVPCEVLLAGTLWECPLGPYPLSSVKPLSSCLSACDPHMFLWEPRQVCVSVNSFPLLQAPWP